MRLYQLLSTLIIASAAVHADQAPSDVIELHANDFNDIVDPAPLMLVEFMAPWCGHCKALMQDYEKAATELKVLGIPVAKVDCTGTAEAELCSSLGIQGYPTLKIFSLGKAVDYTGPRKSDGIVDFMKKRALPVISIVTEANHTDFAHSSNVVVIAYLDFSDKDSLETFTNFAETKRDDYVFGVCHDVAHIKEVASLPMASLVVWKKFDEGRNDFHGEKFTSDNISKFVTSNAVPLLDEVSPTNFALYADAGIPLAYVFIEASNPQRETLLKSLEPVARDSKGKINFVWIDALKFADHAKSLNLHGAEWPAFVIQDISAQTKFPMDSKVAVTHDNVAHFVKQFHDGTIKPSLKSQPIPSKQGPGSHVLVTDEFDSVVYGKNNQMDVFIEFYAPWCGHCKRLKPIWDNLAHSFKASSDKILITKFDATENDVPTSSGVSVQGFPTLKFKPAGSKEFVDYDGDRSLDSLIEFAEKHSANHVKAEKVELAEEEIEGGGAGQIVLDSEDAEEASEEDADDNDAEHDEL